MSRAEFLDGAEIQRGMLLLTDDFADFTTNSATSELSCHTSGLSGGQSETVAVTFAVLGFFRKPTSEDITRTAAIYTTQSTA